MVLLSDSSGIIFFPLPRFLQLRSNFAYLSLSALLGGFSVLYSILQKDDKPIGPLSFSIGLPAFYYSVSRLNHSRN